MLGLTGSTFLYCVRGFGPGKNLADAVPGCATNALQGDISTTISKGVVYCAPGGATGAEVLGWWAAVRVF
jgi:hypothetical protein